MEEALDIDSNRISLQKQVKLSNLQAAVGLEQLANLDAVNQKRKLNAEGLMRALERIENISIPAVIPGTESTYLYFRVRAKNIKSFRKKLLTLGIDTKRDDMSACSSLESFEKYKTSCPVAESLPAASIEIPNNHTLNEDDVKYIAEQMRSII